MKTASPPIAQRTPAPPGGAALPPFDYHPLSRVVFEVGAIHKLGQCARDVGGTRALVVTDPGLEAAGHPQRALASLHEAGVQTFLFDGVEENPTTKHVGIALDFARRHQIDVIVAIGGGSSMDCAKGVNFLLTNGGKMSDYKGLNKATKPMLPSIGIPTTAGTGSEAQSYALIADEKTHLKMACGDRKAAFRVAILDPAVTVSQPRTVTVVTAIDAVSHAVESYVSTRRNPWSQTFARQAWRLLSSNLEKVLATPTDIAARGAMQLGAHYAGVSIENSMLGACHACANPLTAHYGITHGVAIGILLPHVVRFNTASVNHLYGDLVHDVGLVNGDTSAAGEVLSERLTELMRIAELPTRLSDCGVSSTILPILALEAAEQWTGKFNPIPVGEAELLRLYEMAL